MLLKKLLHQRQQPRDPGRRHAGARLEAIIRSQTIGQAGQNRVTRVGRRQRVIQPPTARTGGNHKRPGRHHVGLDPAKVPFGPNAHIAPAGKGGHHVIAVGESQKRCVGADHICPIDYLGRGVRVGNVPQLLNRADRDDVLGRRRRRNAVRVSTGAVVAAKPTVARRKHIQKRLSTGAAGHRVPHRRIVTGRSGVVLEGPSVCPTVVGNHGVGPPQGNEIVRSGRLLKIPVGHQRPNPQINRQHKQTGARRHTPETGPGH